MQSAHRNVNCKINDSNESNNDIQERGDTDGVSICPGPNLAYFDQPVSLHTMVDHIYGRANLINSSKRPHMFIKELGMYIKHLQSEIASMTDSISRKQEKHLRNYRQNLLHGITYYQQLLKIMNLPDQLMKETYRQLMDYEIEVQAIQIPYLATP